MHREEVLVVTVIAVLAAGWWLFGFSTEDMGAPSARMQRVWGRVVRADIDWNGDGRFDESWRFTWQSPMKHHNPPRSIWRDGDFDGRWDLWVEPGGKDAEGHPLATYRVDTDRDGRVDWMFVDRWQSREVPAKIKARRGF